MSSDATERAPLLPLLWKRTKSVDSDSPRLGVHSDDTDEKLLARTQQRDREALSSLFNRYADLAFVISFRILRDRGEAEDLVQEIFLRLFGTNHGFEAEKGSARTWIVQFIYRRALSRRIYLARRHFYVGTDLEDARNAQQEGAILNLEEQIADQVTARQLMAAVEELTEQQRLTIEMHIFQGASLREISQHTGESVENIRHHYYRGLNHLKKIALILVGRRQK